MTDSAVFGYQTNDSRFLPTSSRRRAILLLITQGNCLCDVLKRRADNVTSPTTNGKRSVLTTKKSTANSKRNVIIGLFAAARLEIGDDTTQLEI